MQFLMSKDNVTPLFWWRAAFYTKSKRDITGVRVAG